MKPCHLILWLLCCVSRVVGQTVLTEIANPNGDPVILDTSDVNNTTVVCPFGPVTDQVVSINFAYRFEGSTEAVLLVRLFTPSEPNAMEIAAVRPPASDRAGGVHSSSSALFRAWVSDEKDVSRGGIIELVLLGPESRCFISEWNCRIECKRCVSEEGLDFTFSEAPEVCCSFICGDFTGDNTVSEADYLTLVSHATGPVPEDGACIDLGGDGFADLHDILAFDVAFYGLNICYSLDGERGSFPEIPLWSYLEEDQVQSLGPLIITGKSYQGGTQQDLLFPIDAAGIGTLSPYMLPAMGPDDTNRGFGRIIQDPNGRLYQIHGIYGLIDLQTHKVRVPNQRSVFDEVQVQVGIIDDKGLIPMDAAFDPCDPNILYIVPVLVIPKTGPKYKAAAQLTLGPNQSYDITQLYGKNPHEDPTQTVSGLGKGSVMLEPDLQQLREIELDNRGQLYVISTRYENDNDWVLVYDRDQGTDSEVRISLSDVLEGPTAARVSATGDELWVSTSMNGMEDPNAYVYRFKIQRQDEQVTGLTYHEKITIKPPPIIDKDKRLWSALTDMVQDPNDGTFYVTGFTSPKFDSEHYFMDWDPLFTTGFLAVIPHDAQGEVTATEIVDSTIGLSKSIIWTGR